MIQVCDPPRVRPVRRFSAEEFCFLLRGEAGSLYRPRSEVLRMLTVGEACGVCDAAGAPAGAVLLQPLNADTALAAALRAWAYRIVACQSAVFPVRLIISAITRMIIRRNHSVCRIDCMSRSGRCRAFTCT